MMKDNNKSSVKALKKQLGAAVAMVCVAAVALGSSTYAWFVSGTRVTAETTNIAAQSNSAFMTIENGTTGASKTDKTNAVSTISGPIRLYPATFGEQNSSSKGIFMTGYGTAVADGTLQGSLTTIGTPDDADTKQYAKKEQFNISSRGQSLQDLKVDSVTTKNAANGDNQLLTTAFRVLITSNDGQDGAVGSKWVVYGLKSDSTSDYEIKLSSELNNAAPNFGKVPAYQDTVVNVYLYYEGSDTNIHTQNLEKKLLESSQSVTIAFAAEPDTSSNATE